MSWDRFKALPLWGRITIVVVGAFLLYEFLLVLASPLGGGASGSGRSSFSAKPSGLGAWHDLLAARGHNVSRARHSVTGMDLSANATVVVPGRHLDNDEIAALELFVLRGGRLVVAGPQGTRTLEELLDGEVAFASSFGGTAMPIVPVPETRGVVEIGPIEDVYWSETGPALPVIAADGHPVVAVAEVGDGRVVLISDLTPLENQWLAETDNAAFGVAVVGSPDRPVVFAEAGAAGGQGSGLGAIPMRWRWALVAGLVATLLAMWSSGRRFGPPEDETRELAPPRRAYVDALAATLAKTRRPGPAVAPLQRAARERLIRRGTLSPEATDDELRDAAEQLGLAPDEIDAVLRTVTDDEKAMAAGRAMARLGGTRW